MIAPHASFGSEQAPSHDAIRANQLIEAGLWLRLGGDAEGAQRLFVRALAHDPSNPRAREWLAKSGNAAVTRPPPPAVRPLAAVPRPVAPQPALEVSVILLDEEMEVAPAAPAQGSHITADVLAFLSEAPLEEEKPVVAAPRRVEAPRPVTPARVSTPLRAITPPPVPVPQVAPRTDVVTLLQGVEELLSLGDPSSAMALVLKAEALAPGDARLASARERCARAQQAALEAKLGDLKRVPVLKLRMADLMRLSLDPRAGFLLSRIDGQLTYEALFSVSGMSRLDTLRVLAHLLDQDIITVR
ncbi:hypothetical protein JRI60_32620 [Archangium violaceum]|uniref:hypothetical protein n=1 Tax=Archangium violaceum TaxID=83451 RepID=UPI001950E2DB|nr:hypothetical protein [Archangium violaceum]QRN93886.1 hypothetical protein JRI60_32620 [Archangium violaceum]